MPLEPQLITVGLALIVCPIAFAIALWRARARGIGNARFPLFLIFGTIGGCLLTYSLLPVPMGLACMMFMISVVPIALLINSFGLVFRKGRTGLHTFSMWFGFLYCALLVSGWILAAQSTGG